MSTRSDIIVNLGDGWKRVYCHFDGYLSGVGQTLIDHYNSQERAAELVAPGDMSSLGERCDKPAGHSYDRAVPGCTVYYGRDRGEDDAAGFTAETLAAAWPDKDTWTEYSYVWDGQRWLVSIDPTSGPESLKPLREAIAAEQEDGEG